MNLESKFPDGYITPLAQWERDIYLRAGDGAAAYVAARDVVDWNTVRPCDAAARALPDISGELHARLWLAFSRAAGDSITQDQAAQLVLAVTGQLITPEQATAVAIALCDDV